MSDLTKYWDKIKGYVGPVAPMIGTLVAGPAGGTVGTMIASALGVEDKPEAILDHLEKNPDAVLKIKELELTHRTKFQELMLKQEETRTERHKADMMSDSWLSKNIRPMTLIAVTVGLLVATFLPDGDMSAIKYAALCDMNQWVYGYYFLGRSTEKVGGFGSIKSALLR